MKEINHIAITFPDYPRSIMISKKAKPALFYLMNNHVHCTKKGYVLPLKYISEQYKDAVRDNRKHVAGHMLNASMVSIMYKRDNTYSPILTVDEGITHSEELDPISIKKKLILCRKPTNDAIIGNPTKVGQPVMQRISFQDLYSGLNHNIRAKMVMELKKYMVDHVVWFLQHLEKEGKKFVPKYPLEVSLVVVDTVRNHPDPTNDYPGSYQRWDLENRGHIYLKCALDLLTSGSTGEVKLDDNTLYKYFEPLIEDDDIIHVNSISTGFVPIDATADRYLVLNINPSPIPALQIQEELDLLNQFNNVGDEPF